MKKIIRVAGCILRCEDKILMLLRSANETDPSLWGIPAGKVETNETDLQAVMREVREETSITLKESDVKYLDLLSIGYETFTVEFPVFHVSFDKQPVVELDEREHIDFRWIAPKEVLKLDGIMKDVDIIIQRFCIEMLGMKN